jgi:hypothetical protein
VRTLGASRLIQQDIGPGVELPVNTLHLVVHAFYGGNVFVLIYQLQTIACVDSDQALLHHASTDTAGAEALGEKEV